MSKRKSSSKQSGGATLTFEVVPPHTEEEATPADGVDTPMEGVPTPVDEVDTPAGGVAMPAPKEFPKDLESMRSAFKMCGPKRVSPPTNDVQQAEGAVFYAIFPANLPRNEQAFNGQDYAFLSPYLVQPIAPGRAAAPHEYTRGSKKSKDQLFALNKSGQPLTAWGDTSHTTMRFWGYEKKGFNRGNRVEGLTWTYGGGHCMTMCINLKDLQPRENDGSIPFFMDKKEPTDSMMNAFDLVRVSIMTKNEEMLKKDKKSCFTLKGAGPTVRTLASILPYLRETMHKSKEDAEADTLKVIRGEAPYTDGKGGLLPFAHQVESVPPKDNREDYASSEVSMCSFLQEGLGPETTFMYDEDSKVVRVCAKPTGGTPLIIESPRAAFLKNANAKDLNTACGMYTLASHSQGALCAYVTWGRFWSSTLWDPTSSYGDPTPYRGVPIIDVSRIVTPLTRDEFYLSSPKISLEGRKARVTVPLGFKMPIAMGGPTDDDDDGMAPQECYPCFADVTVLPRVIKDKEGSPPTDVYTISTDMRLAPYSAVPMDIAYVMVVYADLGGGKRHNLMNLSYNGGRDVGCAPVVTGKKHVWSSAIPSAIDEDEDEEGDGERDLKRLKSAMDAVA